MIYQGQAGYGEIFCAENLRKANGGRKIYYLARKKSVILGGFRNFFFFFSKEKRAANKNIFLRTAKSIYAYVVCIPYSSYEGDMYTHVSVYMFVHTWFFFFISTGCSTLQYEWQFSSPRCHLSMYESRTCYAFPPHMIDVTLKELPHKSTYKIPPTRLSTFHSTHTHASHTGVVMRSLPWATELRIVKNDSRRKFILTLMLWLGAWRREYRGSSSVLNGSIRLREPRRIERGERKLCRRSSFRVYFRLLSQANDWMRQQASPT